MILFRLKRIFKLGVKSLFRHLLRSMLTMLGIVFGVGAVVAMLAVGEGASYESQERIKRLGSQNIIIRSVKPPDEEKSGSTGGGLQATAYGLTYADAEAIRSTVSGVEVLVPVREARRDIRNGNRKINGRVLGTVPWYLETLGQKVQKGRFLSSVDMHRRANVCVIGFEVSRKLFPYEDPIGKRVRIAGTMFSADVYDVVGVLEPSTGGTEETAVITDTGSAVFIPITTERSRFGSTDVERSSDSIKAETVELHMIIVKVKDVDRVVLASEMIKRLLERNHNKQDFGMIVPLQLLEEIKRSAQMFSLVLGMIAAISLLVGGIGIMNIMLASVTERTREIGIRRALGAKRRDIIIQFLTETVVLSLCGGVLGLGVGIALPLLIELFTGMKVIFTLWSLVLAFSISALVGLIFGIYPASRAARMDPIEALRHE